MKSWDMSNVKPEDERSFIIQCLRDYVEDTEGMQRKIGDCKMKKHYADVIEVTELYKAIIKHLEQPCPQESKNGLVASE